MPRIFSIRRLGLLTTACLAMLAALGFVACNTEPEVEHRIDLYLADSLSADKGKYDSLTLSIFDTSGRVIRANAFSGPYYAQPTGGILKGVVLGDSVPKAYIIDIHGFQNGVEKVRVQITVTGATVSPIVRIDTVNPGPGPGPGPNPNPKVDTLPTGLVIEEAILTLDLDGGPKTLQAKVIPDSVQAQVLWSTSDSSIASVTVTGVVTPRDTGTATVHASIVGYVHLKDSVVVRVVKAPRLESLLITRNLPVLFTGGPSHQLTIQHQPMGLTPVVTWKSSDSSLASVTADGRVTGKKAGPAIITVTASGANPLSDTVWVTVKKDAPVLTVSADVAVDVGQAATFNLDVTQEYGTITLSWDFTGDGLPEGSASTDTATAKHTYTAAGNYEAVFTATDGEGNTVQVTRRVRVGKQGPLIVITSPKQDTVVNIPQITVSYTSDGEPMAEVFNLKSGLNTLWAKASNALGTDSVSVRVILDTIPPTPPTFDAMRTTASPTNAPRPSWVWRAGTGGIGVFKWSLNSNPPIAREDTSKSYTPDANLADGAYTLTVAERDSVGNWSVAATREIVIQTAGPLPPRVMANAVLTRTAPTFSWVGSGREGARFSVRLFKAGSTSAIDSLETTTLTYAPAATRFSNSDDVVFTLRVKEQDALGNWGGDGLVEVRVDNVAPAKPVFSLQPPTLVNAADTRTSLQWTWGKVAVSDSFVVTLNSIAQPKQAGNTYSLTSFPDGTYALSVVAFDAAGNGSEATAANAVVVDKSLPATPTPVVSESPTRDNTPTWSWSGPAGTQYAYRLARGANPTGPDTAIAGSTFTPATGLSDGTWYFQVRARNAAGNWSTWSASSQCVIKAVAPLAPSVSRNAAVTNAPIWTWTPNGGGDGSYRYRWSGATGYLANGVTATSFAPTALTDGVHNLCVSERDVVGYSDDACLSITIDKTPPVITGYTVSDGFITNRASVVIGYSKDGAAGSYTCALVDQASTRCDTTVYDVANNPATVSRTIWRRSNVVFARAGATGRADGSSWIDAYPNAGEVLRPDRFFSTPSQLWIARGTYTPGSGQTQFYLRSNLAVYGGFSGAETDTSVRILANNSTTFAAIAEAGYGTMITNVYMESGDEEPREIADNIYLSDISLQPNWNIMGVNGATKIHFNRLGVNNRADLLSTIGISDSKVLIENSSFQSNQVLAGIIRVSNSTVVFSNSLIVGNSSGYDVIPGIHVTSSIVCANKGTKISGNLNNIFAPSSQLEVNVYVENGGEFQYDVSADIDNNTIMVNSASPGNARQVTLCPQW